MYCTNHPKIKTNLKCGKCDQFICPKCTISTPVGARCPDCAQLTRLPVFQVSVLDYLKAAGIGLGLAFGLGALWGIVASHLWGVAFLGALLTGYVIGELASRAVNRKQGIGLQIIAGISVATCYLIATIAFDLRTSLFGILGIIAGIYLAVGRFR